MTTLEGAGRHLDIISSSDRFSQRRPREEKPLGRREFHGLGTNHLLRKLGILLPGEHIEANIDDILARVQHRIITAFHGEYADKSRYEIEYNSERDETSVFYKGKRGFSPIAGMYTNKEDNERFSYIRLGRYELQMTEDLSGQTYPKVDVSKRHNWRWLGMRTHEASFGGGPKHTKTATKVAVSVT